MAYPPPPPQGSAPAADDDEDSADGRLWINLDALLWWIKDARMPPLVTTGSMTDPNPGALGQPGTRVLFGGSNLDFQNRFGGRLTIGGWFDADKIVGVEGNYFGLASHGIGFRGTSDGSGLLMRTDLNDGINTGQPIAIPTTTTQVDGQNVTITQPGQIDILLRNQLQGAEANLLVNLLRREDLRLDLLGGFRYLKLHEDLTFSQNSSPTLTEVDPTSNGQLILDGTLVATDYLVARSDFYGGQLGSRLRFHYGRFYFDCLGKVALGDTHEKVQLTQDSNLVLSTRMVDSQGNSTNLGSNTVPSNQSLSGSRDRFAVVPEVGLTAGVRVVEWLDLTVGYSFLYWSKAARAGDQLGLPGNSGIRDSSFWAQGLNFGLDFHF